MGYAGTVPSQSSAGAAGSNGLAATPAPSLVAVEVRKRRLGEWVVCVPAALAAGGHTGRVGAIPGVRIMGLIAGAVG